MGFAPLPAAVADHLGVLGVGLAFTASVVIAPPLLAFRPTAHRLIGTATAGLKGALAVRTTSRRDQCGSSEIREWLTPSKSKRADRGKGYLLRVGSPLSVQEKLRIKFRKSLRKGYAKNIEMDPVVPDAITLVAEPQEALIVRVDSTKGQHYWFSDRRLLREDDKGIDELLRYDSVTKAHWMFRDLWTDRVKSLLQSQGAASQLKANHFDRLEIESQDRIVVLEGLDQAYWPVLHFFWWITRPSAPPTSQ